MHISEESIVGELVAKDYRTAAVFKQNKIDFCCNGNRTITNACEQKKIDSKQLIEQLIEATTTNTTNNSEFNSWPIDLLADYIEKKHHRYVETKIKEIMPFLHKVVRVHGERHPELAEVEGLFVECAEELTEHMQKEEMVLFPFIREMVEAKHNGTNVKSAFGTIQNPIGMMMHEHDAEGERFRKIAALTNNYNPPIDACSTYRVTFSLLKEFEDDLHLHIHLENNILFPKSIQLETQFSAS
ncbi:MAG TPA: iron-sulfur cluster repair di-iron protein [Chitinophagaceae bacterium]|nr:iron-sulfur cluster repair di-iron protein [Chitinophagaceae bacterium]HMZ46437.1 iron-sulfur cluster repair di-iron protein [Chitinophagaceae bacterium]HNE94008.1 iron-sulfur cluster repair di-iron protein [Chitinophagaceae bacterium]HNL82556.1 iron-sulfur cluster repair di-iron protein [Chitinophagaceae bacterium]